MLEIEIVEIIVDLRINGTLPIGEVGNLAYRVGLNAVRFLTAPTGGRKCLFIFRIHHKFYVLDNSCRCKCVQVEGISQSLLIFVMGHSGDHRTVVGAELNSGIVNFGTDFRPRLTH